MKLSVPILVLAMAFAAGAQTTKPVAKPVDPPKPPVTQPVSSPVQPQTPKLSEYKRAEFLLLQRDENADLANANKAQIEYTKSQQTIADDFNSKSAQEQALIQQAYKDAGVTPAQFSFDRTTLTFTAIPIKK